jgi:hypothetical protein
VLAVPAALIVGGLVLYWMTPEKAWWLPPCMFHRFTGLYCPGCGTTRGLHALLHGRVLAALRFNGLTVSAVPLLIYGVVNVVRQELSGVEPQSKPLPPWLPWAVCALIGVFWLVRNIPAYPFTLLAPR